MLKKGFVLGLFGVALAFGSLNSAKAVTLADLIDHKTFINSGDKQFGEFFYSKVGDMPAASAINVIPITDANGNFGIEFQGGFADLPGGSASDALIKYTVCVTDPNMRIVDAHMHGNPAVSGGSGAFQISETFLQDDIIHDMSIFDISNGTTHQTQLTDGTPLSGAFKWLHVQKDIFAFAGTGLATMSFVDQTFSQKPVVPEPGTMALLGAGVIGSLGMFSRRRKKA